MRKIILFIGLFCLSISSLCAQKSNNKDSFKIIVNEKITEIEKNIVLQPVQKCRLKNAYQNYCISIDSINCQQISKSTQEKFVRKINRCWQDTLWNTLLDEERFIYLYKITKSKVDSLVDSDMKKLKNSGLFSDTVLNKLRRELVGYHRQRQFILERDKYNIAKKQENLIWLRYQRPKAFKLCEYVEQLQKNGVLKDGNIVW